MKHLSLTGILCLCVAFSGYCHDVTQITYSNINDVNPTLQSFLEQDMDMTVAEFPKVSKTASSETFTMKFVKHANIGKVNYLYIKFNINKGTPIIKSCEIYGYYRYVVDFYVRYWPTNINFDDSKNAVAYSYYGQDKAAISLNLPNRSGRIIIQNTTIKSMDQYTRSQTERNSYYQAGKKVEDDRQRIMKDSLRRTHYADSVYRDSLITVVDKMGVGYGHKTELQPSIEWLEYILHIKPTNAKSSQNNRP